MRGDAYIKRRQRLWGQRRRLELIPRSSDGGDRVYTCDVDSNLLEPLSDLARGQFTAGDGSELGSADEPGKIQALHSSSAIGCNFFHYWQRRNEANRSRPHVACRSLAWRSPSSSKQSGR